MKNAHGRTCKKTKVYIYLYISLYENLFENGCIYIHEQLLFFFGNNVYVYFRGDLHYRQVFPNEKEVTVLILTRRLPICILVVNN